MKIMSENNTYTKELFLDFIEYNKIPEEHHKFLNEILEKYGYSLLSHYLSGHTFEKDMVIICDEEKYTKEDFYKKINEEIENSILFSGPYCEAISFLKDALDLRKAETLCLINPDKIFEEFNDEEILLIKKYDDYFFSKTFILKTLKTPKYMLEFINEEISKREKLNKLLTRI